MRSSCRPRGATAASGGNAPVDLGAAAYRNLGDVREATVAAGHRWWTISPFLADEPDEDNTVVVGAHAPDRYRGDTEAMVSDIARTWPSPTAGPSYS